MPSEDESDSVTEILSISEVPDGPQTAGQRPTPTPVVEVDIQPLTEPVTKPQIIADPDVAMHTPQPSATPTTQRDPRVLAADTRTAHHRLTTQRQPVRAAPSALRAYILWHDNRELDSAGVAALLRDPPLQTNTVVTYILQAIQTEGLPYDRDRLQEVLGHLHATAAQEGRYRGLLEACGADGLDR